MEHKRWFASMTIIACVVVMVCLLMLVLDTPQSLSPEFTTNELCDWAEQQSGNQFRLIVNQVALAGCVFVIIGRKRAKKGIK